MHLINKYLPEGKKKNKKTIDLERSIMDRKKAIRIPTAPKGQVFKAKKGKHVKYTRKVKHKKKYA